MDLTRKKYLWSPNQRNWYVRIKGKLHPVAGSPGTAEFDRSYWDILSGRKVQAKTSWNALIESYRRSERWLNLKPRTRSDYERVIEYIAEKIGTREVPTLQRKHVIDAQEANRHRVRFANYIPQVLSVLCEHAIDIGWLRENPAKGTRALAVPDERRREHVPWPDAAVATWRAQAQPLARLIFEIGVGSVQRPSDWTAFRWGDYDGDSLRISQGKTGVSLILPCTMELVAALERAKASLGVSPHPARHILSDEKGRRLTYRTMARIMLDERKRLGLEAYDLHALRYRGVAELAWKGCTDEEISSYSGHASLSMIRKYAGQARQIMRARQAREKRQ